MKHTQKITITVQRLDTAEAHFHYRGAWADEHQQNNKNGALIYRSVIYRAY